MEPKLRGIMEKNLDDLLKPEYLETMLQVYEDYKPIVKSIEDAMFGDIVATMQERFVHYAFMFDRKAPTETDTKELFQLIKRRAQEIRSQILLVTSR